MSVALDFSDMFRRAPDQLPDDADSGDRADCADNTENEFPIADKSDMHSWVKTTLKSMNFSVKDEDLTQSSLETWQRLLSERMHWQNQSQSVIEENISLRRKYENLDREKSALKSQVEGLQQDISAVHGKMAAMQEDQRQTRCHWLAEKNELDTRCFQAQAQATQYQGTIRKKDKDYEKLQAQLAKIVKDSSRGQKSVSVITKPLPKNFQESSKTVATLKDVELADARVSNRTMEAENTNLRNMFNQLTSKFEEVQRNLTMSNIAALMGQNSETSEPATPIREEVCSPLARPYQSVVKQALSSAKEANRLSLSPPRTVGRQADEADLETLRQLQKNLCEVTEKLACAQKVINEQDSLIHAALLGKLPGLPEATESLDFADSEDCDVTIDDGAAATDIAALHSEDHVFHIRDFLSPASPATMELLGSVGAFWSPVVPQSSSKIRK